MFFFFLSCSLWKFLREFFRTNWNPCNFFWRILCKWAHKRFTKKKKEKTWKRITADLHLCCTYLSDLPRSPEVGRNWIFARSSLGLLNLWAVGLLDYWAIEFMELLGYWVYGLLAFWIIELLGSSPFGLLGCWAPRLLGCWTTASGNEW